MSGTNDALLAYLHLHVPFSDLACRLKITPADLAARVDALLKEGLVHRLPQGQLRPTALVITRAEAARYLHADLSVVGATADAIAAAAPAIEQRYRTLPGFAHTPFSKTSLLVLSNALLDNWQIDRVEEAFLRKLRPLRGGGRYYYAVFEVQKGDSVDTLGIYGNHSEPVGAFTLSLYGNQRYSGPANLVTLTQDDLISRFGYLPGTNVSQAQKELVGDLVQRWRDPSAAIPSSRANGLRSFGLIDANGQTAIPVLTAEDERGLESIAASFTPTLVDILEGHRSVLLRQYRASPYAADGVSFEEFFIWWYHIFYTEVTNELARRGLISMPPNDTLTYLVES